MTYAKQNTRPDATASNPNAVSVRIEPKTMSKAKFQRRHDFRIGAQPAYVDGDRTALNRHLIELRPLPEIQRENEALRKRAGRTRKMKSNAAVVTAGIITFGHIAQALFNNLPDEIQDRAFTELAQEIAAYLKTTLEALVVHLDETATHAHFTMRAYNDDGEPISNATGLSDMAALQDLAAVVMQRYAPDIERGNKKKARFEAGANYADIRTTNPIESTFATVRHRTDKTKGCLSRKTGLAMAFKLMMSAQTKWRKLDGANRMPEIIEGIVFKDGIKQLKQAV